MSTYALFATTPKAMEGILVDELQTLGAQSIQATTAGIHFRGDLETAYRCCLWSRTASRILLVLSTFSVHCSEDIYQAVQDIDWFKHLNPQDSLAVSFSVKQSEVIANSHFGALKVKDAIVDQFRHRFGSRPQIDTERPSIRIYVHLNRDRAQLGLDLSGESLHRRGYRDVTLPAPMKENLAAAILFRSNWLALAKQGKSLIDPMCGSGTLLIEAALIAADYAPGLLRAYFGFLGWKQHNVALWDHLKQDALRRRAIGLANLPKIIGFDLDSRAVSVAQKHCAYAGLESFIHIERRPIADARPAKHLLPGLVICNPPYGERLGDKQHITELYKQMGEVLKQYFLGWDAALIISDPELGFRLGIRSRKPITFFNGALECKLLRLNIEESAFFTPKAQTEQEHIDAILSVEPSDIVSEKADMFANRLQKNFKKRQRWAKQRAIFCYRIYDADLPEYAVAIDLYQGEQCWVNVQEYEPPKHIDPQKANQRLAAVLAEIPQVLAIPKEHVFLKVRRRQRHIEQYEKLNDKGQFYSIDEGGCRLLVNFEDYLDTGLFLDHRPIRLLIQQQSKGKRFLNLFAYTGSASVHAAVGGASTTTSVDMSNTYLNWARRNMALNTTTDNHTFIQADCLEWLSHQAQEKKPLQFDLIFLDPPTFSNSKRMQTAFDIQIDHVRLLNDALRLLSPTGTLYFSTNFRRFRFDYAALSNYLVTDISRQTIPDDFERDLKIHYCWKLNHVTSG